MAEPLACFLTWTTYGTWLPGDARRWVDKKGSAETPYRQGDSERLAVARRRMKQAAVRLDAASRQLVEAAIRETCRYKRWPLHALNVRSNHVHVVVTAQGERPERIMTSLKAWASRRLNQAGRRGRWWTRHGSTRYITSLASLAQAVQYVVNQ